MASPDRKSSNRTGFSDVPTAMSSVEPGCDEKECEYGVLSRLKVCTGVIASGSRTESLSVRSCEVVMIVDGTGSKGYIEMEVIA